MFFSISLATIPQRFTMEAIVYERENKV